DTLTSANNLAYDLWQLGEYEQARRMGEDALARRRRVLGEDHPDTLISANNLAYDLRRPGSTSRLISWIKTKNRRRAGVLPPDNGREREPRRRTDQADPEQRLCDPARVRQPGTPSVSLGCVRCGRTTRVRVARTSGPCRWRCGAARAGSPRCRGP